MSTGSVIFLLLLPLSCSASSSFKKCCPPGEVYSGVSTVDCIPSPPRSTELYATDFTTENVTHGFPICEKPEDISTKPLYQADPDVFLQERSCIDILHVQNTSENVPLYVYCSSNKDRDRSPEAALIPHLLNLRRCCSNNTVFNISTGNCEPTFNVADEYSMQVDDFLSLLPRELNALDFLNIHRGLPRCAGAMFTYEIRAEDLTFHNGDLKVTLPGRKKNTMESFRVTDGDTCLELTPDFRLERRLVARVCRDVEFCAEYGCIKKCCAEEEEQHDGFCRKMLTSRIQKNFYQEISKINGGPTNATGFGTLVGLKCPNHRYPVTPDDIDRITEKGHMQLLGDKERLLYSEHCLDVFNRKNRNYEGLLAFVCFGKTVEEPEVSVPRYVVSSILEAISCIFLLLTLTVYICLPTLQNVYGKTVMCHSASLLGAFACLCIIPWVTPEQQPDDEYATTFCSALGFTMLFFFLSTFCWLNVMCFDIWRTFGRLQGKISGGRRSRRFLMYSVYAWGLPLSITAFCILSDNFHLLPEVLQLNFGVDSCWFYSKYGELLFFKGPVAIQLTLNVVFFILTAEQCSKVKAELRRVADPLDPRSRRFHADKTKFIMNVKLFIVMGIPWVAEIVSSFVNQYTSFKYEKELFYATDVLNCLQGVLIFFLFLVKRRVHQALKKRLGFDSKKKSGSSHGTSTLQDPYKMRKSTSNTTLTSSFAVSVAP